MTDWLMLCLAVYVVSVWLWATYSVIVNYEQVGPVGFDAGIAFLGCILGILVMPIAMPVFLLKDLMGD